MLTVLPESLMLVYASLSCTCDGHLLHTLFSIYWYLWVIFLRIIYHQLEETSDLLVCVLWICCRLYSHRICLQWQLYPTATLVTFFWVKSSFGLISRSHYFGEACSLYLQGWIMPFPSSGLRPWRLKQHDTWKYLLLPTSLHGDLPQKNISQNHNCENLKSHSDWLIDPVY